MSWLFIVTFVTGTVTTPMTPPNPGIPEQNAALVQNQVQEIAKRVPDRESCLKLLNEWKHKASIGSERIVEKKCTIAPPEQPVKSGRLTT